MPPIEDYPSDLVDFEKRFSTEKACQTTLFAFDGPMGTAVLGAIRTSRGRQAGMALSSVPVAITKRR